MALDFPASPSLNQTFTIGSTTWKWDGSSWTTQSTGTSGVVTETDPLFFASPASTITNANISNWNTTYNERLQLTDFSVTNSETPLGGGSLTYNNQNGSFAFVPPDLNPYLTQESDTLSTVTARGATTTSNVEVNNLVVNGDLTVQGGTTQVGTYTVAANEIVILDGISGAPSSDGFFRVDRGTSSDVSIKWNETLDKWQFTNDGSTYVDLNAYDLTGSNNTTNQAIISLSASDGTSDTIEFAGSKGTTVSWDGSAKKVTIESTTPVNADWNSTSGLSQILNKPVIPAAYTLPTASTTVLGGVKIDGTSITINNGIISAAPSGYSLPIASANTLGGIKVGSGLTIDGNGVLDVTTGAGTSLSSRQELSGTTASLNDNETGELNITGYKAYSLFQIETSDAAWVRVYINDASRDNDINRSEGNDPGAGSGVIAEVRTFGAESVPITPGVIGFNLDVIPTTDIYVSVTNRSGSTQTITVTLTAIKLEV